MTSRIYTTLRNPIELRKDLLKANIEIIELMEDFEGIRELRTNKHNTFLFMKAYIKEIHSSISRLRLKFPHLEFDEEDELKKEAEKIDVEFEGYSKDSNEIDKLEKELFVLREKLREMDQF